MGTTDITRTFFFGSPEVLPDKAAIAHASAVLAAHIELARALFPKGQQAHSWMRYAARHYGQRGWISDMARVMEWGIYCRCMKGLSLFPNAAIWH